MAAQEADPLSFFAGDASSSSESEDEEEKGSRIVPLNDKSYYTSSDQKSDSKLPPPDSLFSSVGTPQFLTSHLQPHYVDWDKLAKNTETNNDIMSAEDEFSAVPPPPILLDSETQSEIAAAPIKYATPPANVDSKLLTVSSNTAATGSKRPVGDHEEGENPEKKKQKGELFREKEKRKRDLGMSSRGKSFVEEEKRILRQQFGQ